MFVESVTAPVSGEVKYITNRVIILVLVFFVDLNVIDSDVRNRSLRFENPHLSFGDASWFFVELNRQWSCDQPENHEYNVWYETVLLDEETINIDRKGRQEGEILSRTHKISFLPADQEPDGCANISQESET